MSQILSISAALCRDCGHIAEHTGRCAACARPRLLRHAELFDLSIAHVDCDAFFAAVEKRDDPSLEGKPVIIGGGRRGVVATCCYLARAFGVRSAMPMFKALKLCPQAVVVPPKMEKYTIAGRAVCAAMEQLTPLVQPLSIDEAFLDLTGTRKLHGGPPAQILAALSRQIEKDVGITVSVGLSHNKLLAKIASNLDKPRGFAIIGREETLRFLAPRPPQFIFGVGKVFAERLARDGITALSQLQNADPQVLAKKYGEQGLRLHALSRGEDNRPITANRETKSISGETTFTADINNRDILVDKLYALTQKISKRAKAKELAGKVITLKLKTARFRSLTRRLTLPQPSNYAHLIFDTARDLLYKEEPASHTLQDYRLIGVGLSSLSPASAMESDLLFPDAHHRNGQQEDAIDALRKRFGDDVIGTFRDQHRTNTKKGPPS